MQIPPSQRAEVKPQQEPHAPTPGTETHSGGGEKWGHGRGTEGHVGGDWAPPGDFGEQHHSGHRFLRDGEATWNLAGPWGRGHDSEDFGPQLIFQMRSQPRPRGVKRRCRAQRGAGRADCPRPSDKSRPGTRGASVCLVTGDVTAPGFLIGQKFWRGVPPRGSGHGAGPGHGGAAPKGARARGPLLPRGRAISRPVPQLLSHKAASPEASGHGSRPHPASLAPPSPCLVPGGPGIDCRDPFHPAAIPCPPNPAATQFPPSHCRPMAPSHCRPMPPIP